MSSSSSSSTTPTIPTIKIALKAGGDRNIVVQPAEAQAILARFQATLQETKRRFSATGTGGSSKSVIVVLVVICKLDLSCRAWTPDAILVLRPFLESIAATLEILKVDDIIASLHTDVGLQTLQHVSDMFSTKCPVLQEVNLNDNALGTRGLACLKPLLSLPTITRVYLENCGISKEAAEESLLECFHGRPLTHVAMGMNQLGEKGGVLLGQILTSSKLEYFSYKGSRPMAKGTHGLLQGLAAADTSNLLYLDLNETNFTTSLDLLSQVLVQSPRLQYLILRDGTLEEEGLRVVLKALYTGRAQLRLLDLGAMFSDDNDDETKHVESALELGRYLSTQWSTLETLVLGDNEWHNAGILALISASGALFTSPERSVLRTLNLETCMLTGSDVLHVLAHNHIPSLKELILVGNMDLTSGPALKMLQKIVKVDDDLEEEEEEEEDGGDDVDDLADELAQGAQIAD